MMDPSNTQSNMKDVTNSNHPRNGSFAPKRKNMSTDGTNNLPIADAKDNLMKKISKYETMIILAETGCGKTTQIPQYILEYGLNRNDQVVVTQPRRIAAVSIAQRVSEELSCMCGELVGYKIRFQNITGPFTKLIYATDGTLLREAVNDDLLLKYSVIILDEAHERTVTTDILFGVIQTAQERRSTDKLSPLKVIIMSAALDVDHFRSFFKNCPVLYIEGRHHEIDIFHTKEDVTDYYFTCLVKVFNIHMEAPAHESILVFLTGQEEIEKMAKDIIRLSKSPECKGPNIRVHTLYAAANPESQLDIFTSAPEGTRKVIISTNIAETSVTIPDIKFVIDSGKVKIKSFNPVTGVNILKVESISREQALQRAGRAGREFDGVCYRSYSAKQFEEMKKRTVPEIHRCNLSAVSLTLLAMNKNPRNFNFIDKPEEIAIKESLEELHDLGAISDTNSLALTEVGQKMSFLPLDPKYSKILLSAEAFGCVNEILNIIAMLSTDNIFLPSSSSSNSDGQEIKEKFYSSCGDHLTLLNVFRSSSQAKLKQTWCNDNFINFRAMDFAKHIKGQLLKMCSFFRIHISSCGQDTNKIRKCLISGLFKNIAFLQPDKSYRTMISKQRCLIHPSSVFHQTRSLPHCVLFTELTESSELYMKTNTSIDLEWLPQLIPNYVRKKTMYCLPVQ